MGAIEVACSSGSVGYDIPIGIDARARVDMARARFQDFDDDRVWNAKRLRAIDGAHRRGWAERGLGPQLLGFL
jgi:hypothetical protein